MGVCQVVPLCRHDLLFVAKDPKTGKASGVRSKLLGLQLVTRVASTIHLVQVGNLLKNWTCNHLGQGRLFYQPREGAVALPPFTFATAWGMRRVAYWKHFEERSSNLVQRPAYHFTGFLAQLPIPSNL